MGASFSVSHHFEHTPEISVEDGVIKGLKIPISPDKNVRVFLGIPYAEPPVGALRLKKPVKKTAWSGVLNCFKYGPRAPERSTSWQNVVSSTKQDENCLHLNIFTPELREKDRMFPVLFFIHGGGFVNGTSSSLEAEMVAKYICRHDVIVVTVEFRLGLLGWFCLNELPEVQGNQALWDVCLALQWVQTNIGFFNGNKDNVTVMGHNSGAVMADLLSISPHSRDLFQNLILMSGCAEGETLTTKNKLSEVCRQFLIRKGYVFRLLGFDAEDTMSFLKTCRTHNYVSPLNKNILKSSEIGLKITPVVGSTEEEFLPKPIAELRKENSGRTIIIGTTEEEGLLFALFGKRRLTEKTIDKLLNILIPNDAFREADDVRNMARSLYLDEEKVNSRQVVAKAYIQIYGDIFVNNSIYFYLEKNIERHRIFVYSFDFHNPNSLGLLGLRTAFRAATYGSEMTYLVSSPSVIPFVWTEKDGQMTDLLTRMWSNFCKYSNPNGPYEDSTVFSFKWDTVDQTMRHLSISTNCHMKADFHGNRGRFWKGIIRPK